MIVVPKPTPRFVLGDYSRLYKQILVHKGEIYTVELKSLEGVEYDLTVEQKTRISYYTLRPGIEIVLTEQKGIFK